MDAFVNFMQTDNVAMAHYNSMARTRFNLYKYDYYNTALNCILNETGYRMLTLIDSTNKQHYLRSYLPVLVLCGLSSTPLGAVLYRKLNVRQKQAVTTVLVLAGLMICTAYLVASTYNPFLYFRF